MYVIIISFFCLGDATGGAAGGAVGGAAGGAASGAADGVVGRSAAKPPARRRRLFSAPA